MKYFVVGALFILAFPIWAPVVIVHYICGIGKLAVETFKEPK